MLFFSKCFVEFTCKDIWSWTFACWDFFFFFNYCSDLITVNWSLPILYLLVQSWEIVFFKKKFLLQCHFTGLQLIIVVSYGPLYFCGIGYNFFFLILLFYWFGPSPFLSWWICLKLNQFCLLFSENKLFVSLIFSIEFINAVSKKKKTLL